MVREQHHGTPHNDMNGTSVDVTKSYSGKDTTVSIHDTREDDDRFVELRIGRDGKASVTRTDSYASVYLSGQQLDSTLAKAQREVGFGGDSDTGRAIARYRRDNKPKR